jgi:seryl-tRNA synthetase
MLQVPFIRENHALVVAGLKKRQWNDDQIDVINQVIILDDLRKASQTANDNTLSEANRLSKEIGILMQSGKKEEGASLREKVAQLKEEGKQYDTAMKQAEEDLKNLLYTIPNIPHHSVPNGKLPEENEVYQDWTQPLPKLAQGAVPHWELAQKYNIFDLELGVKITGAGFPVFRGKGARLERALINFFLDEATKAGYEEIVPPLLVNEASARATGQLPDKEGQMYYCNEDDLYLIPTAEVPLTNIYRDVILTEKDFPVRLAGYTPCFRREAGSYGAHVRGLNRVHQFDKIEIVNIAKPDQSYKVLDGMLKHVCKLLTKLELPYRILRLCGGDMGFTSALTFDFEVYSAAQDRWLEVSSVSNFETYQTNRLKLRYKDANGKIHLAHSLNGSAMALARIVAALLENNQTPEGILIPKALQKYTKYKIID